MPIKLLLFALGVIAVSFSSQLPSLFSLLLLFPSLLLWRWQLGRYGLALLFGVAWGIYTGHSLLNMQLAEELVGKDLVVMGQIQGLPEQDQHRLRFNFRVSSVQTVAGQPIHSDQFPPSIQLSWYQYKPGGKATDLPVLGVGDPWQLRVRLKR